MNARITLILAVKLVSTGNLHNDEIDRTLTGVILLRRCHLGQLGSRSLTSLLRHGRGVIVLLICTRWLTGDQHSERESEWLPLKVSNGITAMLNILPARHAVVIVQTRAN